MYHKKMQLLQIIARFNQGGTARWLTSLVSGLRLQGAQVELLAGNVHLGEVEDQSFLELNGIRIPSLARNPSIFKDFQAFLRIRKLIIQYKPEILNTHTTKAGAVGRIAAISILSKRPKIVHTIHGHLLYGYFSKTKTRAYVLIEKVLFHYTDVIVVPGVKVMEDLISAGIGDRTKYRVVLPGVEKPTSDVNLNLKEKYQIPSETVVVGWVGRLTPIKRPFLVLELAKLFKEVHFLIAGDGEMRIELEKNSPSNVHFLGWENPAVVWENCDIALLTSANEAIPISLIEAGLFSKPIIAEDVGAVREIVFSGINGFLIKNIDQRIQALQSLLDDQELRLEFGMASQRICQEKFGLQAFISNHLNIYESLL